MHDVAFGKGANLCMNHLLLFEQHASYLEISDSWDHRTLHDCATFVVFDVAHPDWLRQRYFFGEPLLFEIANGIIISVCEKMLNRRGSFDIVFEVGHKMSTIAFDLLIGRYGTKNNFCELSGVKRAVCYASKTGLAEACSRESLYIPHHLKGLLDNSHRKMCPVVHQPRNVVFWHLRELLLKYTFQTSQYDHAFPFVIIIDDAELDVPLTLFFDGGLPD